MKKLLLLFVGVLSLNIAYSLTSNWHINTIVPNNPTSLANDVTTLIIKGIKAINNQIVEYKKGNANTSKKISSTNQTVLNQSNTTQVAAMFFADVMGDYQSHQNGSWTDPNSWEYYNGSVWVYPAPSYPGQFTGTNTVTIQATHTITAPANANPYSLTTQPMGDVIVYGKLQLGFADANIQYNITLNTNLLNIATGGQLNFNGKKIKLTLPNTIPNDNAAIIVNGDITYNNPDCLKTLEIYIGSSLYSACKPQGTSTVISFGDVDNAGGSVNAEIINPSTNPNSVCGLNQINLTGGFNGPETNVTYQWTVRDPNSVTTNLGSSGTLASEAVTNSTSFTPSIPGQHLVSLIITTTGGFTNIETRTINVISPIDFANLQWPPTATICEGENTTAYGQIFENGLTNATNIQAPDIVAEFGYNTSNTDPSTWTTWATATFNTASGINNNDEYKATFGASLSPGTYYYTFRYALSGCDWVYGGYPNGFWNGTTQKSGMLTVKANHAISLSSGSNIQTVCNNSPIENISYALSGGATNANVSGLPTGVNGSLSGSTYTISGTPTQAGTFNYAITTTGNNCTTQQLGGTITVKSLDYVNLQHPPSGAICPGGSYTIYGQVYEPGITEAAGQGAGIEVEFGYNNSNNNPSTWTNWLGATYNGQGGTNNNNDEYKGTFGNTLAIGTYYYTFRYRLTGCDWQYGGLGGTWNNNSGVLTVQSLDYVNLQFPANATICEGGSLTAYGQVYEPGLTESAGAGNGIVAQLGYGTNTNPASWTNWVGAAYNGQKGTNNNNDEYKATFGSSLSQGTYYYTFRYSLNNCEWQYGYFVGTSNLGVLTVNSAPEITTSYSNISVSNDAGLCEANVNYTTASVAGVPTPTITYSQETGTFFPVGTTTVTVTATNSCGTDTKTFDIIVNDEENPSITCPSDINVFATSAAGAVVNYTAPVGTDNCSATTALTAGLSSGETFPIGTTTVTYTTTDTSGNVASCSFDVEVVGVAPEIICPANITVNNDIGQCGATVNFAATDNVGIPASTITYDIESGTFFNIGKSTVTATATNAVGSSSCTFEVTVNDTEAPNVVCKNKTVQLDANGNASITTADIDNGSNDACGIASLSLDKTSFDCSNLGPNTVLLTVTDNNNNVSTCTATVTVEDNPVDYANLQYPGSREICENESMTAYGQVYEGGLTDNSNSPITSIDVQFAYYTSNTDPSTWPEANWIDASPNPGYNFGQNNDEYYATFGTSLSPGTYYYTFRYSLTGCDWQYGGFPNGFWNGSNRNNGVLTVLENHTLSLISANNNQTVCPNTSIDEIVYAYGGGGTSTTISPALPAGLVFNPATATISGTPIQSGIYNYTISTVGNNCTSQQLSGSVTVKELLDYANLQFPGSATICTGGSIDAYGRIYEAGLTPNPGNPGSIVDAEFGYGTDPDPLTWINWSDATYNVQTGNDDEYKATFGSSLTTGTYYYTFRYALDGCEWQYGGYTSNGGGFLGEANVVGVLTVNEPPVITNTYSNISVITDSGVCGATVNYPVAIAAGTPTPTISYSTPSGSFFSVGNTTVTVTATNSCGTDVKTFVVSVTDNEAPVISCKNITVDLGANGTKSIVASDIYGATPTDNCGIASISIDKNSFDCADVGASNPVVTTELFISEYIEGSSNNKAIEIFNGTGASINLNSNNYALRVYSNGATTFTSVSLSGTIASGDVFVIANPSSNAAILSKSDQTSSVISYNGNDAVALVKGTTPTIIDVIGQIGFNPGTQWGTGLTSTEDNTLRRKSSIVTGDGNGSDAFDPSIQWDGFATDDSNGLGSHSVSGGSSGVPVVLTVIDIHNNESKCTAYVTVQDNIAPVLTPGPDQDVNLSSEASTCQITIPDVSGTATDNCSGIDITQSPAIGAVVSSVHNQTTTVTVTATDASGNTDVKTVVLTAKDITPPVLTPATNQNVNLDASCKITVPDVRGTATDNCSGTTIAQNPTAGTLISASHDQQINVIVTATDLAGLTDVKTVVLTAKDVIAPTVITQNITVQLNTSGNASITPEQINNGSTDNCGTVNLVSVSANTFDCSDVIGLSNDLLITEYVEGSSFNKYIEIFNGTGNTVNLANYELRLYTNGSVTPTTTNPLSGTLANGAVIVYKNSAAAIYSGSASVLSAVNWNGDDAIALFNTVSNQNADIFGRIGNDPGSAWTLGGNTTENKTLRRKSNVVNGITISPTGTGVGAFTTLSTEWDQFNIDDVSGLGSHGIGKLVTLTINDGNGNSATGTAYVTVEDNIDPTIDTPAADLTVQCDGLGNTQALTDWLASNGGAQASDACGIVWSNNFTALSDDCGNTGTATVIFTVTDPSGNTATTTGTFTIEDTTDPEWVVEPFNKTVECNGSGNATELTDWLASFSGSDVCGTADVTTDYNAANFVGDCGAAGYVDVKFTLTDACSNAIDKTVRFTIEDTTKPDLTIPLDVTINCEDETSSATNGVATATDNCSGTNVTVTESDVSTQVNDVNDAGYYNYTITRTWTAVDECNNSIYKDQIITVQDVTAPIVNCEEITIVLDDVTGEVSIIGKDLDSEEEPSSDNCDSPLTYTLSQYDFSCSDIGGDLDELIISEYVDGTGSNKAIEIFNGTGITVDLFEENYSILIYPNGTSTPIEIPLQGIVTDREVYVVVNFFADVVLQSKQDQQDSYLVFDGNDAIVLVHNGTPVDIIGLPGENPGTGWNESGISTDNTTLVRKDTVLKGNVTSDGLGTEWIQYTQDTFSYLGTHTATITDKGNNVLLTVTDVSGNSSTCEALVYVQDKTPPVASCQSIIVQLDDFGNATITPSQINNGSNDACGIKKLELDKLTFGCLNIGANTVTLTVTDSNDNTSQCTATVTVEDNINPVAVAQNITVQLDASGNVSITPADIDNDSNDACGIDTMSVSPSSFTCSNVGDNTVTLTVTDNNGNSSSATATVTVEDNVAPTVACNPIEVTLNSNGTYQLSGFDHDLFYGNATPENQTDVNNIGVGSSDNCDIANMTVVRLDNGLDVFNCDDIGALTNEVEVTLTVTDVNGKSSSCNTIITVKDTRPKIEITGPAELPEFCQDAAMILTANIISESGQIESDIRSYVWSYANVNPGDNAGFSGATDDKTVRITGNGTYTVLVTSETNCTTEVTKMITGFDVTNLISSYTILAEDEIYLHGSNLVQSGGLGVESPNGLIKLYQATTVSGFGKAANIDIKQGSTLGTPLFAPAAPATIPVFVFNTQSNAGSLDATIPNNQTLNLTASVYDVVSIGEGATVTFTQPNVYINELITQQTATIEFAGCTNVYINKKFTLAKYGKINVNSPQKVVFYVNADVQIEKGSYVRARMHSNGNEFLVKGENATGNKAAEPTYMKGLFICRKVHGSINVIWEQDDICDSDCQVPTNLTSQSKPTGTKGDGFITKVKAWPNPSNTEFNFRLISDSTLKSKEDVQIQVFDMSNKLLHSDKFKYDQTYIFGKKLEGGTYIVKLTQAGQTLFVKIVKY